MITTKNIFRLFFTLSLFCTFPFQLSWSQEAEKPNIILILFDDLGYNDVGYNGSEVKTPIIDALVQNSTVLTQLYATPWCSSTRAGLETGIHPASLGMRSLQFNFSDKTTALPPSVETIAEKLQKNGYHNVFLGKWHLSKDFTNGPIKRGYQKAYGFLSGQIDHLRHDDHMGNHVLFRDEQFIKDEGHMTDLIVREAVAMLATTTTPFFLSISFSGPHYPVQSLPEYENMNAHITNADRRAYAGMITHMDAAIGKIIEKLRQTGHDTNTYTFILSDNGGQVNWTNAKKYYNGRFKGSDFMASNNPYRDSKTSTYEGGIRVPGILIKPNHDAGLRDNNFYTILDIAATILSLAGLEKPNALEGSDMLAKNMKKSPFFYWQTNSGSIPYGGGKQEALRWGNFKLIKSQQRFSWFPYRWRWPWDTVELYNLADDFEEKNNLVDKFPDVTDYMLEQLANKMTHHQQQYQQLLAN